MKHKFTVIIQKEDDWYVAKCAENNVASQGKTLEESMENLREAVELYYEDTEKPTQILSTFISTIEVFV
jgi:predicted RNase H-like HicB family nuclease